MLEGYLYERLSADAGTATVRLLGQSPLYRAHFPDFPVTPGAALVQIAMELMGCRLQEAREIKFLVPVLPSADGPVLRFNWQLQENGQASVYVLLPDGLPCAKMSVQVR